MKSLEIKWKRNEERLLAFNSKHSQDVLKPKGLKTVTEQNNDPTFNYLHRFNDNAWLVKCEAVPNPRPFEEKQTVNFFFLERFPSKTNKINQDERLIKKYESKDSEAVALGLPTFKEIGAFHYYRVSFSMVFDLWALKPNTFKENVQSYGMTQNPDLANGNTSSSPAETILTNFPSTGIPSANSNLYDPSTIKRLFETQLSEKLTNLYTKLPKWLVFIVTDDSAPVPILYYTGSDQATDMGMSNRQQNLSLFFDIKIEDLEKEHYITLNKLINDLTFSDKNPERKSPLTEKAALFLLQEKRITVQDNGQFSNTPFIHSFLQGRESKFGVSGKNKEGVTVISSVWPAYPPFGFDVQWPSGKFRIADISQGKENLDKKAQALALYLKMFPEVIVKICATTDNVGSEDANLALSQQRAVAIKNYLENSFDISSSQLRAIGEGEARANIEFNRKETSSPKFRKVYFIYD